MEGYLTPTNQHDALKRLHAFLKKFHTQTFDRGEELVFQNEIPKDALIIKSGIVRMYDISPEGDEKTVAYGADNDIMSESWVFKKSRTALYYCQAFTKVEAYGVSRDRLLEFILTDPGLLAIYLDRYLTMYIGATFHIDALEYSKAQDKLLRILQFLAVRFGEYIQPELLQINLRLTQQDLANMIGLSRETTAIELGKLRKQGVVSCSRHRYIFKESIFSGMAGADDFIPNLLMRQTRKAY